jgi:PAS domain S-box-containing protein
MVENIKGTSEKKPGTGKSGIQRRMAPRLTIGVKFVSFVVLVALLAGAIVGWVTINTSSNSLRQQVLHNNLAQADLAASFASNYINAVQAHVQVFAERPDVKQAILSNTPEQIQPVLANFVAVQTALDSSGIYDTNGIQKAFYVTNSSTLGQSFADREWFQKTMSLGKPYLGTPIISRATGKPIVPFSVPIMDGEGKIRGVIAAAISLASLSDAIVNIDYGLNTRALLIDTRNNGLTIATKDPQLIMTPFPTGNDINQRLLTGDRGVTEIINVQGEQELIGFAPVPDLPWEVMVITPSKSALSLVNTLTQNASLYTGLIILFAAIAGIILMLGVTRPLRRLIEETKEIGRGNLDCQIVTGGRDEIGDLSKAFGQMAQQLKQTLVSRDELVKEVAERKKIELALVKSEKLYRSLFENMLNGLAYCKMLYSEGQPQDFIYLNVNRAFETLTGLENVIGKKVSDVIPGIRQSDSELFEIYSRVALSGKPEKTEIWVEALKMWFSISIYSPEKEYFVAVFDVITERKKAEEELKKVLTELGRSNDELQRFAYIASHDLQEPLRMVASYVQLLERRYKDKLDPDANDFINFAVDGTKRMQNLINALLTYSRVGSRSKPFQPVNLEEVFSIVLINLQVAITESRAEVTHDPLPTISADEGQITQIFQNLISNAVKFHRSEPPRVHVSAEHKDKEWIFSVADNGIGIEPQYFDLIFTIFQRLHGQEYPGTGAGLSIAKRIVERHGGRIWVESQAGRGSTFYFSFSEKGE